MHYIKASSYECLHIRASTCAHRHGQTQMPGSLCVAKHDVDAGDRTKTPVCRFKSLCSGNDINYSLKFYRHHHPAIIICSAGLKLNSISSRKQPDKYLAAWQVIQHKVEINAVQRKSSLHLHVAYHELVLLQKVIPCMTPSVFCYTLCLTYTTECMLLWGKK